VRLLVTGERGSGKTTWCREYIDRGRESGLSVGGILCPGLEQQGQRVGSNAVDLLTDQDVPFARLSRNESSGEGEEVGDYTISRDGILFARAAIKRAIENRCDLVVIDEVGPLELSGKGLMPAVEFALASATNVLIVVRSSLKEALQKRFAKYEFVVVADLMQSSSEVTESADGKSSEGAREPHSRPRG
jgi:molybdopterin-guanine dinucleotide biosynthesis protein A